MRPVILDASGDRMANMGTADVRTATDASPVRLGNPACSVCGKPNLFHPISIDRGICASCLRTAEVAS